MAKQKEMSVIQIKGFEMGSHLRLSMVVISLMMVKTFHAFACDEPADWAKANVTELVQLYVHLQRTKMFPLF